MFGQKMDRFHLIMYIGVKDSIATFKGEHNFTYSGDPTNSLSTSQDNWYELEYWKSKSSAPNMIFKVMDKAARSTKGEISYLRH
jgi:hypothetical protein